MRKILVLLLMLGTIGVTEAQETLTIEEAISIALQRNTSLIIADNNLEVNKARIKSEYGDFLPTFGLSGSWSWNRRVGTSTQYVESLDSVITFPERTTDSRSYSVSAGGNMMLFDGLSNFASLSQSKNEFKTAEYDIAKLKQDIVYQTTELYYNILNARELLKFRQENVEYHQKLLETISERNRLGSIPVADVYTQQVQLGNAQLALIEAENQVDIAKTMLLDYLALDVLDEYEYIDPFDEIASEDIKELMSPFGSLETMVMKALNQRYDYSAQKLYVNSREEGVTIAQSGLFPTLSGNYGFSTSSVNPDGLFDQRNYSAGLTLSLPLFSNWNTEYQVQAAKVNLKNSMENLEALKRQIKIEVKQGYLDLSAARKQLEVSINNVKAAGENRKIQTEKYNLGSGTILDVLQADRDYTDAIRNRINAEYEFFRLRDRLINYIGELDYKKYE